MDSKFLHKITEASKVNAELQHKIEQLQAKHNKCVLEHTRLISENLKLQAERDRYKEALEAIIKHNESIGMTGNYKLPMTTTVIAQKALGGSDE